MAEFDVGDLIQMEGESVPREYWHRFWRVTEIGPRGPILTLLPKGEGEAEMALKETMRESFVKIL